MVSMVFQDGENEGIVEAYAKNIAIVMKKLEMSFDQAATCWKSLRIFGWSVTIGW